VRDQQTVDGHAAGHTSAEKETFEEVRRLFSMMDKPLQSTSLSFWQCARNLLAASFNSETLRSRTAVHTNGVSTVAV